MKKEVLFKECYLLALFYFIFLVIQGSQVRIQIKNFQKIAFTPRISNYVHIQPLGHKKQFCEGLCQSI